MSGKLTRFQIMGLYGRRTYDIEIDDNTLILVGENGMGKTTVLKFLLATISGAFRYLPPYKFDKLVLTIDNCKYELRYKDIAKINKVPIRLLNDLPSFIREEILDSVNGIDTVQMEDVTAVCAMYGYPYQQISDNLDINNITKETQKTINDIKNSLNSQVLYLPTYRRIEEDLPWILRGKSFSQYTQNMQNMQKTKTRKTMNKKLEDTDYIELVEFGMQDVKEKIKSKHEDLSRFSEISFKNLTYMNLGDVVDRKYETNIRQSPTITEEDIAKFKLCSSRISETVLSSQQLSKIIDTVSGIIPENYDTHSQMVLYNFRKLLELQSELEEREQSIRDFCKVCNEYLVYNSVEYDDSKFMVSVFRKQSNPKDEIDMSYLSSGEKQIVSLFSHLYLSKKNKYFVLIDEPELSLSVPWQKTFLENIRNSNLCNGLVATTHSPFIYDNELIHYTHGLGEFITDQ